MVMTSAPARAGTRPPGLTARLRQRGEAALTRVALEGMLRLMDLRLLADGAYRSQIYRPAGPMPDDWRACIRFTTRDGAIDLHARVGGGRVRVGRRRDAAPDVTMTFRDPEAARALLTRTPAQVLDMLLDGSLYFSGNLSHVARLSYMLSGLVPRRDGLTEAPARRAVTLPPPRRSLRMEPTAGARHLEDPGFADLTLDDFPRLRRFLEDFFSTTPEMCTERPRLYTEYLRAHGDDRTLPVLRQAGAFNHLMSHKQPILREGDLIAGTTTARAIGVIVYPECGGIPIWPELQTMSRRRLNPYRITPADARVLNDEVFPYWIDRNVREVARARHHNPRALQLDERFILYFQWKTQAISHTIPDFPAVLSRGLVAIRDEARQRAGAVQGDGEAEPARGFYQAVAVAQDGVLTYAENLARHVAEQARAESDPVRRAELEELAGVCARVPAGPARTLHEALQSIWTTWIGCHMENTNAGLSIGRLDQWLQPYLEADLARVPEGDADGRRAVIRHALELCGCFYLRCTDHLPQVADLGNKLFGGSSSDQVITLGGVTPEGQDGVNDMTYVLLKVTEMLGLRDPNVNARYHEGTNPVAYLRRLCEVNLLTGATPSIHNDRALVDVLVDQGMAIEHARDWSATGCVEPTSCGRHYGHTNCMMFNMVSPLEMALHDGFHPLIGEQVGPRTGDPRGFTSFDQVLDAYFRQLENQIKLAVQANNLLGNTHRIVRPTPLLSALIQGPMDKGRDLVDGGALYNGSGTGNVGLVDVVDSLVAIEQLVFVEKRVDMATLLAALDADFAGHEALHARVANRVPKYGSGHPRPRALAERVIRFTHDTFRAQPHYRGGVYNSGFWSMSNHVAFGLLTGALPSGRRRGKAFTPGITPAPARGASLVEHIHDVAALDHHLMPNNIAFNLKVAPGPADSQETTVGHMAAYVRAYVQEGGMQLQFNVVSSETLRDAMAHPERYPTLMVRISGYNAYFNDLNDDMKLELIERAEHRLGAA